MATKRIYGFLFISFLIHTAKSGHSLQYYHMTVSSPGHGLPEFISVGYVDGIQITRYCSDTGRTRPVAPWMKKWEDPEYWEEETQNGKHAEDANKLNVKIAMYRFNQTGGFHSFQEMYGCELRDDGSTRGFWQFGYDGKDFLALDTERGVYSAFTDQAQISAQRWNRPGQRAVERAKDYLETDCIDWLKRYLEYGMEEPERRVRPEVKVSGHGSDGVTKLHCQVYGFYPRDVDVNWKKNGTDIPSDEAKQILPNTDGTFQIRVTVAVILEDGASYACQVEHSSLNEPLIVMWSVTKAGDPEKDGKTSSQRVHFVCIVMAAILLLTVVAAVLIIQKLKLSGWKRTATQNQASNSHHCNAKINGWKRTATQSQASNSHHCNAKINEDWYVSLPPHGNTSAASKEHGYIHPPSDGSATSTESGYESPPFDGSATSTDSDPEYHSWKLLVTENAHRR